MKLKSTILIAVVGILTFTDNSIAGFRDFTCFHNGVAYGTTIDPDYCPAVPLNHLNHINHNKTHNQNDPECYVYAMNT